ncbi:helix-turn-helix domain-containing protein [Tepidanaerobacter syntrophicus]|uniref:helix-turn-helix domain-containing protein n=1 Tax=Tepidanaerobacter syntrophicus TaxID=224999 RepID=UPI001BD545E5|nr:helix-turn-helix transcriptional regulator [Tepidanaerobacter syntrophicus]
MIESKIIRSLRQKRNMTLEDLARQTGLSVSYLSEVERGKKQPSLETLEKISQALNISRDALLSPTSPANTSGLGAKISIIREEKGMSLSELAEKANISPSYLCQIENSKVMPALSTLKNIAAALDVEPELLMASTSFVGYKIKKIRRERNITQAQLAKKAGVSTGLIGQIESGKVEPSIKTLEKIAAALSLSPCFFVSEDDELASTLKSMNPEIRELLNDPRVRSALELLADCSTEEFTFILKFIQLYKEHRRV